MVPMVSARERSKNVVKDDDRKPEYSIGEHEAWEVALHQWRVSTQAGGGAGTTQEEIEFLSAWITQNTKSSTKAKLCSSCAENIAEQLLHKQDPFICPLEIKKKIQSIKWRELR